LVNAGVSTLSVQPSWLTGTACADDANPIGASAPTAMASEIAAVLLLFMIFPIC